MRRIEDRFAEPPAIGYLGRPNSFLVTRARKLSAPFELFLGVWWVRQPALVVMSDWNSRQYHLQFTRNDFDTPPTTTKDLTASRWIEPAEAWDRLAPEISRVRVV